jgi:hypothetical protein
MIGSLIFSVIVLALFGPKGKRRTIASGLSQPSDNWRRSRAGSSVMHILVRDVKMQRVSEGNKGSLDGVLRMELVVFEPLSLKSMTRSRLRQQA